jgi:phosphohistidine swiveling domain-containing protein
MSLFALELKEGLRGIGAGAEGILRLRRMGLRTPRTWIVPSDDFESISDGPGWMRAYVRTMSKLPEGLRYSVQPSLSVDDLFSRPLSRHLLTVHDVAYNGLAEAMNEVAGSVVSEGTRNCLRRYGHDPFRVKTAIMVKEETRQLVSGAVFSCDPLTGMGGIISEMIADGEGLLPWKAPVRCLASGTGRTGSSLLPEAVQAELENAVRMAAEMLRGPVWMEFLFDGDRLSYLRSQEIDSLQGLRAFSRDVPGRHLPGLVGPMVWSVIAPLEDEAWTAVLGEQRTKGTALRREAYRLIAGRAYSEISARLIGARGGRELAAAGREGILETSTGLQDFQALGLEEMDDEEVAEAGKRLLLLVAAAIQHDILDMIGTRPGAITGPTSEADNGYDFSRAPEAGGREGSARSLRDSSRDSLRRYYLEIGRRMVAKEVLLVPEDIFYLSCEEAAQILAGGCEGNQCNNYRLRAFLRRQELEQMQMLAPPEIVYGEATPPVPGAADRQFSGIGASSGYFQGRACRPKDTAMEAAGGAVLIVPDAGPEWVPVASSAGAVIAASGGLLSPLSVAARESGIPAVVSLADVSDIREGTLLTVDAFSGTVYAGAIPR